MYGDTRRKTSNPTLSFGLAVFMLVGVFGLIFYFSGDTTGETEVAFGDGLFEISGSFGRSFDFSDVSAIELKESMPEIGRKNNGAGLGKIRKGYFVVEDLGECLLFIETDSGPYIYIEAGNIEIFMNYKDPGKTEQLYEDFMVKWSK